MTDGIGLPLLQSSVRAARQLAGLASRGHPLVPLLIAALLAALLALVLPLAAPNEDPDQRTTDGLADDAVRQLASEDLAAFRTSERWGVSLQEARERAAADRARREELERAKDAEKSQAAWSPELQAIGFVGVVITASERVVLLMLPAAEIGRFHAGDVLEDGRTLAVISEQALVLQHKDGQEETLALFPRASAANVENPPTEGE